MSFGGKEWGYGQTEHIVVGDKPLSTLSLPRGELLHTIYFYPLLILTKLYNIDNQHNLKFQDNLFIFLARLSLINKHS